MGTVWKRLQRAGKRAAKVRFVATLEELLVEGGGSWTPDKLSVVWTRRNRRVSSKPRRWQPGIQNPLRGMVVWVVPESLEVVVTLYRDPQANTFDDKQWKFLVVNESRGHRSVLAGAPLDLGALAGGGDTPLSLSLRPRTRRVTTVTLRLRLRGVVIREGHPTDEDMQSVTSLSPPGDVADLGDFESDPEDEGGPHRGGGVPPAPRAPPTQEGDRGGPPALGAQRDPPEPGGDPETPPKITAPPPGGRGALLAWCQGVTAGCGGVSITDFGGSWSSGLGFCALLHRLRPQLIDFNALDPRDHRGNNKLAFDAFAALGVPRLLDPSDMERPDSLGVMTFLSQVRAHLGTPLGTPPDPRTSTAEGGLPTTPPDPGTGTVEGGTPPRPQIGTTEGGPQQTPPGTPKIGTTEGGPQQTPPGTPKIGTTEEGAQRTSQLGSIEGGPQQTPPGTPGSPKIGPTEGGPQRTPPSPLQLDTGPGGSPSDPQLGDIEGEPLQTPPDPQPSPTPEGPPQDPQLDSTDGGTPSDPQMGPITDGPPPAPPTDTGQEGPPQDPQIGPTDEGPPQTDTVEGGPPQPPPAPQLGSSEGGPPPAPQTDPAEGELSQTPPDPPLSPGPGGTPPGPHIGSIEGGPPQSPPDPQPGSIGDEPPQDPPPAHGGPTGPGSSPGGLLPTPRLPRAGGGCPTPPPRSRTLSLRRDPPRGRPPKDPPESPQGHLRDPRTPPTGDVGTPPVAPPATPPSDPPTETPKTGEELLGGQWVVAELVALEQDQARLDARAPALERELRELLESGADPPREERLLQDWFELVQQRNLLVRRQDELQLLAQERDLERRFELLSRELRGLLGTDEWQKPPAQRQREQLLLEELVALVERRDRLVWDRHRRESRAQEEDEELARSLDRRRRSLARRESCGIA